MKNIILSTALLTASALSSVGSFAASHYCQPSNVFAFTNRVHVKCSNPAGKFRYFAVSTKNKTQADQFLKLATSAFMSDKRFYVRYDTNDKSGNSWGCKSHDCRRAYYFGIVN